LNLKVQEQAMTEKFSRGDQVMIKSGGPAMTVHSYCDEEHEDEGSKSYLLCMWFRYNERKIDRFHEDTLKLIDKS
jgi:uncharacterized protein YodC (DUF2158 family)